MNLLSLRTQFVKLSGRYDLVVNTSTYADNGADFYINAGQKLLDRLVSVPNTFARIYLPLSSGEYSLTWQYHNRAIKEVWATNTTERYKLKKKSLSELKELYSSTVSATTNGAPIYYAPAELIAPETTAKGSLATFIDKTWTESDTKYNYRGIVISPPADESYVIEVSGLFDQFVLTNNTDENFWTIEHSALLLRASLYQLESFSRGTENAKNWLSAIETDVMLIERDIVEEEIADVDQMEG